MTEEGTLSIVRHGSPYQVRYASNNPQGRERQPYEWVAYLSPADNSPRLTRRLSQGLKVLDELALMTSQQPSEPW
jgi:hypothetical protein